MERRIKIVIVSWMGMKESSGGLERVTYYMHSILEKNYEIEIIDFEMIKRTSFVGGFLGKHYVIDAIVVSAYLHQYLKKYKRNDVIVITQGFNAPFIKADIQYAHGTMRGFKVALRGERERWRFGEKFEKLATRRANTVIAVEEGVRQELITYYNCKSEKIHIINNCIDTKTFYPLNERKNEKDIRILFCGRLERGKGVEELLRLAIEIEQEENIKLLIATTSDLNIELFKNFKNTKIYRNIELKNMNSFYNEGDILFFPSMYEGFGLVIVESLAAGIPVLGNDLPLIKDFVKSGIEGVYLRDKDKSDLVLIKKISRQYRSFDKKMKMHRVMEKQYSNNAFEVELQNFIGNYIMERKQND